MRTFQPAFLAALLVIGLVACQQGDEGDEAAPADTVAVAEPEAPAEVDYTLVVTNPMPHAMNVTAVLPDGSQVQLGTVPASGDGSFSVNGVPGESVTVTATDEGNTHSPTGAVILPDGETMVAWTVE